MKTVIIKIITDKRINRMDKSKNRLINKRDLLFIAGLLAVFAISFFLWGKIKSVNFCDEIYSYILSNSMNEFLSFQLTGDHWYVDGETRGILAAVDGFQFRQVMLNNKGDVHPPVYYFAMHFLSVLRPASVSKWIGLLVNFGAALVSIICVYILIKQITGSVAASVLSCLVYISSPAVISMNMFIRMYAMFSMWVLLFVLTAYNIYKNEKNWLLYPALFAVTVCGFLTQYYFAVFCVLFTCCYCINKLQQRRFGNVCCFVGSLVAAVVCATVLWPTWIKHMFSGYLGGAVTQNAFDFSKIFSSIKYGFVHLFTLMYNKLNFVCAILLLVMIVFLIINKCRQIRIILSLIITAVLYSIAVVHLTPTHLLSYRYFFPVVVIAYIAFVLSLYYVGEVLSGKGVKYMFVCAAGLLVVLNFARPLYDLDAVSYVDRKGDYRAAQKVLEDVSDIPWIYYGYENSTMTELLYDSTMSAKFIMVNALTPFDDKEFTDKDSEFILFAGDENSYFDENVFDSLANWFKGELNYEELTHKGYMTVYKVTHTIKQ